jgi:hypothetical protein
MAEISVPVPLNTDLGAVVDLLRTEVAGGAGADVLVTALDGGATVTLRVPAPDAASAERVESDLRVDVHRQLRAAGLLG